MKTKIIFLLMCLAIVLLSFPVSAHSGGTDSQGGHYDHSTGEYHYHHGHSAHSHYDIDGDGIKDCPLKQKTSSKKLTPETIIAFLVCSAIMSPYAYIFILSIIESNSKLTGRQCKTLSIFIVILIDLLFLAIFLFI